MEFSVAVERKCAYPLYEKHAELWTLRILCRLIGHERGPLCTGAVKTLRQILGEPYSDSYKWAEMEALWRRAEDVLSKLEQAPRDMDAPVFTNIRLLGMQLSLSAVAQQILALRVLARIDGSLCSVMEGSPSCDQYRLAEFFSVALDEKPEAIIESLRPSSALIASGLLSVERAAHDPFHKTRVLPWLTGILMVPYGSFEELFAAFAKQCTPSTLALSDFRHIAEKADLLTRYLARACAERAPGRNVLLYGPPGTGKTELARLAASVDGLVCYEGDVSDEDGEPLDVGGRLRALGFLQRLLQNLRHSVVLFDEVEDVFKPREGLEPENRTVAAGDSKGWTVKLLESNPTPTIWISNRVYQIDPAVLRRFDLVLEISVAPLGVRRSIVERSLHYGPAEKAEVETILRGGLPAPALLTRAARVSEMVSSVSGEGRVSRFRILLGEQMRAQGHDTMKASFIERTPFNPEFLNSEPGTEEIIEVLVRDHRGRLLVHGPSGSGKTAFAHYAAERLDVPIQPASVRTLYSGHSNEFLHNIRIAFERARYDGAILLLDDMDWLASASAGEFAPDMLRALSQMQVYLDDFPGIVICTACRAEGLAHGFLRRFAARLKTNFLTPVQTSLMIRALTQPTKGSGGADLQNRDDGGPQLLSHLDMLTPGDIEAALRMGFAEGRRITRAVYALEEIQRLKTGRTSKPIGFIENTRLGRVA